MKIVTEITVSAHRADGTRSVLTRSFITDVGDNPAFERGHAATALGDATEEFSNVYLSGEDPI
jgi:hypothetical protein